MDETNKPAYFYSSIAPGKFTISGEHSAIYGAPVLVQSLNCFTTSSVKSSITFNINLKNLDQSYQYTKAELNKILAIVQENFKIYKNNSLDIAEIIPQATNLAIVVLANFLNTFNLFNKPCSLSIHTDLPIGSGLGSSSSMSVSIIRVLSNFYGIELSNKALHDLVQQTEEYQSGKSSGVDSFISINAGTCLFQKGNGKKHPKFSLPYNLVNTGIPTANTGTVVMHVANKFKGSFIWNDFEQVTLSLSKAIKENDYIQQKKLISINHRLLCDIGVVPKKIQEFIADIENEGAVAKISGAGSHIGSCAGTILIVGDNISKLVKDYAYSLITIK